MSAADQEQGLTDEVLGRLAATPDPRLREVMTSLVRHLHEFAREVRLTEAEWFAGVQFLTAKYYIAQSYQSSSINNTL